jgi:DNA-binding transcriptional MerR regulator
MPDAGTTPLTTAEVALHLRVTFRQLDYWVRSGWLPLAYKQPGSGVRRLWSADEVAHAEAFAALVHAGVAPAVVAEAVDSFLVGPDSFAARLGALTVTGPLP